jgi:hypothetical protein
MSSLKDVGLSRHDERHVLNVVGYQCIKIARANRIPTSLYDISYAHRSFPPLPVKSLVLHVRRIATYRGLIPLKNRIPGFQQDPL